MNEFAWIAMSSCIIGLVFGSFIGFAVGFAVRGSEPATLKMGARPFAGEQPSSALEEGKP